MNGSCSGLDAGCEALSSPNPDFASPTAVLVSTALVEVVLLPATTSEDGINGSSPTAKPVAQFSSLAVLDSTISLANQDFFVTCSFSIMDANLIVEVVSGISAPPVFGLSRPFSYVSSPVNPHTEYHPTSVVRFDGHVPARAIDAVALPMFSPRRVNYGNSILPPNFAGYVFCFPSPSSYKGWVLLAPLSQLSSLLVAVPLYSSQRWVILQRWVI